MVRNIICATGAGTRRKWAAKKLLIPCSSGLLGIICIFNGIWDNLSHMVDGTNCQQGEFGVCGEGRLGRRCARLHCLFHHLTVITIPQRLERRAWSSLGSLREGKDFPSQRMMTGRTGNPSLWICQICPRKKKMPQQGQCVYACYKPVLVAELGFRQPEWFKYWTLKTIFCFINAKDNTPSKRSGS